MGGLGSVYIGLHKLNRDFTSIVGEAEYHRKVVLRKDDPVLVFAEVRGEEDMIYYIDQVDKPLVKILVPVDFIDVNVSSLVDALADRIRDASRVLVELISNRVDDHFMDVNSKKLLRDAEDNLVIAKDCLDNFSNSYGNLA